MRKFLALLVSTYAVVSGSDAQCGVGWEVASTESPGSVAICYDPIRREVLTQSGGALWGWNGQSWALRWTEPLLDGVDAMVFDQNRGRVYVFGGAGYDDRLWTWDGSALSLVASDTIGGRAYAAVAFDWKRDRLVIHGGQAASQGLYSSWHEWNPATNQWTSWADGPIGRLYAHKMVYDPVREVCVLHGGFYFFNRNATWTWNGASWSMVSDSGPARYVASMAWDSVRNQVVLHGGTTCCGEVEYSSSWTWQGSSWTQCSLEGPARGYTNMAFDAHRDRFVLPGGIGPTPAGRQWIPMTNELRMSLCIGDIDDDRNVTGNDLGALLASWGINPGSPSDLNQDGLVDGADLGVLLNAWGPCPL
jgi:hypothetical protein